MLLEAVSEGGFINPSVRLGQVPVVVVDSAGNIYMPDPDATDNPLAARVVVRNVGPAGVAQIIAAIQDAGLDQPIDDGGISADTGVTVFTVEIDGQETVNRITASGPGGPGAPGGGSNPALDLLTRLTDPTETWGASDVTSSAYVPLAYRVYFAPTTAGDSPTLDWPLATPLADFGAPQTPNLGVDGLRSGIVSGADTAVLAAAIDGAMADTVMLSGGAAYQVWIRPLLPPEIV